MRMAPAAFSLATTEASSVAGVVPNAGQAAVVAKPAASMLSFAAKGTPYKGREVGCLSEACKRSHCSLSCSSVQILIQARVAALELRSL